MTEVAALTYKFGRELFGNVLGAHAPEGALADSANRSTCPYCQLAVRTVLEQNRPFCYETVRVEVAVCDGCRWWRKRWTPERYFTGEVVVGVLHVPEREAVSRAANALDAFEAESRWADWTPATVKHRRSDRRAEAVSVVRELRGAMVLRGLSRGMVVTTATHFSQAAREAAQAAPDHSVQQNIDLVDARRLLDVLRVVVVAGAGDEAEAGYMIDDYWPSVGPQSDDTVAADVSHNLRRVAERGLGNGYIL